MVIMALPVFSQMVAPVGKEKGISAYPFDLGEVTLNNGRLMENQNRTLTYLKWVDMDRLLYVFRSTHKLPRKGAKANTGWE